MTAWRLPGQPGKYGNRRMVVDGISFASRREARRYAALKLLEQGGVISGLERQPRFRLETPIGATNARAVVGTYIADFRYVLVVTGAVVIEDAKGFKTELYQWKKRHVEAQYQIVVREV